MRGLIIFGLWLILKLNEALGDLTYYFDDLDSCQPCADSHANDVSADVLKKCAETATRVFHRDCGRCVNGVLRRPKGSRYVEDLYSDDSIDCSASQHLLQSSKATIDTCIRQSPSLFSLSSSLEPSPECDYSGSKCFIVHETFADTECSRDELESYVEYTDGECYTDDSAAKGDGGFDGRMMNVLRADDDFTPLGVQLNSHADDYLCAESVTDTDTKQQKTELGVCSESAGKSTKWSLRNCLVEVDSSSSDDLKVLSPTFTVEFSTKLLPRNSDDLKEITVARTDDENDSPDHTVVVDGSKLDIRIHDTLPNGVEYTVTVPHGAIRYNNGEIFTFRTVKKDLIKYWIYMGGYIIVALVSVCLLFLRVAEYRETRGTSSESELASAPPFDGPDAPSADKPPGDERGRSESPAFSESRSASPTPAGARDGPRILK